MDSKNLRSYANQAAKQAKSFFHHAGDDAYDAGNKALDYAQDAYPKLAHQASDVAQKAYAQSRGLLSSAANEFNSALSGCGKATRSTALYAAKLGVGYGIIKFLSAPERESNEAAAKVKAYVQDKPVESALLALGAGYLLGKLLR